MSIPKHHKRQEVCASRAPYREGRKAKAVKVYTVNQESKYLLVQGVPAVGATHELVKLFAIHGAIEEYRILDEYQAEQFTEVYLIKFKLIQAARHAKRKLDDWSFFGGVLHVCYAPEYETVQETREKLSERRRTIAAKTRQYAKDGTYSSSFSAQNQQESPVMTAGPGYLDTGTSSTLSRLGNDNRSVTDQVEKASTSTVNQERGTCMETRMNIHHQEPWCVTSSQERNTHHHNSASDYGVQHSIPSATSTCVPTHYEGIVGHGTQTESNTHRQDTSHQTKIAVNQPEEQLWLPRPPKQIPANPRRLGLSRHNQLMSYEYALVPTAQAEFPVGFDARLGTEPGSNNSPLNSETPSHDKPKNSKFDDNAKISESQTNGITKPKTLQEKIEENLKKKDKLVIKEFKPPRAVTKFVPRQAQPKQKLEKIDKVVVIDTLNKKIRKDAFTLGKSQGPVDIRREPPKEPDAGDLSVDKSVKDIRKRMIQFSENPSLLTKKKKVADD